MVDARDLKSVYDNLGQSLNPSKNTHLTQCLQRSPENPRLNGIIRNRTDRTVHSALSTTEVPQVFRASTTVNIILSLLPDGCLIVVHSVETSRLLSLLICVRNHFVYYLRLWQKNRTNKKPSPFEARNREEHPSVCREYFDRQSVRARSR